ncbi:hypothetical protein AK973_5861 [Pseudomonas brassicacearum]|nr:hypothetical protein AK973_5861 [Pseudomonas brassicacearum]
MLNRLRFIQLVHAQHFVETSQGHPKVDFFEGLVRHHRRKRRDQRANPTFLRGTQTTPGR